MDNPEKDHFRPTASNVRAGDMYAVGGGDRLQLCGVFLEEIFRLSSRKTDASLWFVVRTLFSTAAASAGNGNKRVHPRARAINPVPL